MWHWANRRMCNGVRGGRKDRRNTLIWNSSEKRPPSSTITYWRVVVIDPGLQGVLEVSARCGKDAASNHLLVAR